MTHFCSPVNLLTQPARVLRFRGAFWCRCLINRTAKLLSLMLLICVALPTHAAGSNMPWEAPLQSVLESIQGPVARIIAVIIIITTGLTLAFGDTSGGFRKLVQIVFGLSIAFAASSFFLTFFSFAGGALV
jgi:type IV secretion system protein TrbC